MNELEYNPETGILSIDGKEVGWKQPTGYRHVSVEGKRYIVHRLVWFLYYGEWPSQHIDHINGIKDDNRIENLRDVSRSINLRNQQDKIKGYHRCKGKWRAQYSVDNKVYHIGMYKTEQEARQAYLSAVEGK